MPNINSLPTITQTSSGTFVIASDNGFARRMPVSLITDNISAQLGSDQGLYTTSSVRFGNMIIDSIATNVLSSYGFAGGYNTFSKNIGGSAVTSYSTLGYLSANGYDGVNDYITTSTTPNFALAVYAFEPFAGTPGVTTNAGTAWVIAAQPNGTIVSGNSVQAMLIGASDPEGPVNGAPTIVNLYVGSGIDGTVPQLQSSDGTSLEPGYGRTNVQFFHSRISQHGITENDTAPENSTLTGTNFISIHSSRYSAANVQRQALMSGDSLGGIQFRGSYFDDTTSTGYVPQLLAGAISMNALEDFTYSTGGTNLVFSTVDKFTTSTNARLTLSSTGNLYTSAQHTFKDSLDTNVLDVTGADVTLFSGSNKFVFHSTGTMVFPDNTVQTTAYPGFSGGRSVPVPAHYNSTGTVGDLASDSGYVYICVATDTWRRIAHVGTF